MFGYGGGYGAGYGMGYAPSEADIKKQQSETAQNIKDQADQMSHAISQRSADMKQMIEQRAAAQIAHMTAVTEARRDQEIARLEQQVAQMSHKIDHDKAVREAQITQTANAATQRHKQAVLAQEMQQKVYEQMKNVAPDMGFPGAGLGGYGGGYG